MLGKLSEHSCQSIILNITVSLDSHIQNVNWFIPGDLNSRKTRQRNLGGQLIQRQREVTALGRTPDKEIYPMGHSGLPTSMNKQIETIAYHPQQRVN